MPIRFSPHSLNRLRKRGISRKLIRKAVETPDKIIPSFRGRKLRQLSVDDTILEVVTKTEGARITVITAYFLD